MGSGDGAFSALARTFPRHEEGNSRSSVALVRLVVDGDTAERTGVSGASPPTAGLKVRSHPGGTEAGLGRARVATAAGQFPVDDDRGYA